MGHMTPEARSTTPAPLSRLNTFLHSLPPGSVTDARKSEIARMLREAWHELRGVGAHDINLFHSPETMAWEPPILSFSAWRFRAYSDDLQAWRVNVVTGRRNMSRLDRVIRRER